MGDIVLDISFPLDDDGFFRRECPLCSREFKVKLTPEEMRSASERCTHALLVDAAGTAEGNDDGADRDAWCPYCGQRASLDSWWTQEQLALMRLHMENVMARLVNEHLIRPMQRRAGRSSAGPITVTVTANEMQQHEPWIAPEPNDMTAVVLPCCQREVKVDESWKASVHCFFCGFPHELSAGA
jgi:hypothetical protein